MEYPSQIRDRVITYYQKGQDERYSLNERLKFTEQALASLQNYPVDTLYFKVIYQKSWLYFTLGQYDSLVKNDQLIQKQKDKIDKVDILGMNQYLMGYYYEAVAQKPDSSFLRYNNSRNYFQGLNDSIWISKSLLSMAIVQKNQSDFFGSKETLTEALHYLDREDTNEIASAFSTLATNHRKLYNYKDAETYFLKAIALTESDKNRLAYKNNLAATYIDKEDYAAAAKLLSALVEDSILDKASNQYPRVLDNLAYAAWLSGKPTKKESFLEPLHLRKQAHDKRGLLSSYTHLGAFYSKTKPQRAEAYFDTVIQLSKTIQAPRAEQDALKYLMQLFPDRVGVRNRYIFLQDSLYAQELKVKTQFAKYKYDDRLQQESILRLEKENAEKELEATRQRNFKHWFLGGVLGLLFLIIIGYYGYQQRVKRLKAQNRVDRMQAAYQTETLLSRRLHDDFGAGLHHAMQLIQSKAATSKILDELDALYQQSRDFSREINAVNTGAGYKDELIGMLNLHKPDETRLMISGSKEVLWEAMGSMAKVTLYKVLRELFINMTKHSQATTVTLNFKQHAETLEVRYSDNGIGISKNTKFEKNGLRNTEKRIEAIGGTLNFESNHGQGFKALVIIPN